MNRCGTDREAHGNASPRGRNVGGGASQSLAATKLAWLRRLFAPRPRVSWDDAVAYIEHPSHTLGRQASPHSPPPQAP
jgi:hypothetical protein